MLKKKFAKNFKVPVTTLQILGKKLAKEWRFPRKEIFGTNSCLDHTYFYYTAGGGGNKDEELDKCWSYNIHTFPSTCTRILPNYNHKWLIIHAKHIEDDLLYCNPRISLTLSAFRPEPLPVVYCRKPLYFTSQDLLLPSSAQVLSPSWAELSFNCQAQLQL